jgi:hypothetical protein
MAGWFPCGVLPRVAFPEDEELLAVASCAMFEDGFWLKLFLSVYDIGGWSGRCALTK